MTDALDAAERKAHEACPCFTGDEWNDGCRHQKACACWEAKKPFGQPPCLWPGHDAIRDLRREAYRQGVADARIPGFVKERP